MKSVWQIVVLTLVMAVVALLLVMTISIPFIDLNSTTLVFQPSAKVAHDDAAQSLAKVLGNSTATLDTPSIERILFKDGTSVDWLVRAPDFHPMYDIVALKTITLGLFSSTTPSEKAAMISRELEIRSNKVQVIDQPDPAFPPGAIVIVLSNAYETGSGYGFGILIRKHAFRLGGPRPAMKSLF